MQHDLGLLVEPISHAGNQEGGFIRSAGAGIGNDLNDVSRCKGGQCAAIGGKANFTPPRVFTQGDIAARAPSFLEVDRLVEGLGCGVGAEPPVFIGGAAAFNKKRDLFACCGTNPAVNGFVRAHQVDFCVAQGRLGRLECNLPIAVIAG